MAAADVETMKQTWLRPPRQRRTIICAKCQWNLYEPLPCPLCDSADFDNGVKSSPAYRIPRVQVSTCFPPFRVMRAVTTVVRGLRSV